MKLRKSALTLWLTAPIAAVVVLCAWIVVSMRAGPKMQAVPVGAGAGQTGGANALGEWIAHRHDESKVRIVVEDRTGQADATNPLLLGSRANGWQGESMTSAGGTRWEWAGPALSLDEGFEVIWTDSSGELHHDLAGRRTLRVSAGEQVVVLESLVP